MLSQRVVDVNPLLQLISPRFTVFESAFCQQLINITKCFTPWSSCVLDLSETAANEEEHSKHSQGGAVHSRTLPTRRTLSPIPASATSIGFWANRRRTRHPATGIFHRSGLVCRPSVVIAVC